MTVLTTICYLKKDQQTLMLYRNKKENDINEGKWIGIGGKLEKGESPMECNLREFYEETNLTLKDCELKAIVTFPGIYHGQDEIMFLYVAHDYSGTLTANCQEGELAWIADDKLNDLPMWEGDHYFESWISRPGLTEAKFVYHGDKLVEKKIKNYQI